MDKESVVTSIYNLSIPQKVWKYADRDSLEDFSQHCYLLLLELDQKKFDELVEQGQIVNYFYTICKRQAAPDSDFWKAYKGRIDTVSLHPEATSEQSNIF